MLSFVTPARSDAADRLADLASADAFWQSLPRTDPIAAQKAVCGALAESIARGRPSVPRLRALLALDQRAGALVDALLINYDAGDEKPPSLEGPHWQAAFALCLSFGQAHRRFLASMRESVFFQGWRGYLPQVVLRMLHHRQIELLLRPFVAAPSTRSSWKELHEAYRFAVSQGGPRQRLAITRVHSRQKVETTLEREYIHLLLQDFINGGHFPPHDAFWANRNIPRWCEKTVLEPHDALRAAHRLVVDPDGDAGLARATPESADTCLDLDPAPVLDSMRDEIASLGDVPGEPGKGSSWARERRRKLLRKLAVVCAPERQVIPRRGERKPVALTIEVVAGVAQILRNLRDGPQGAFVAAPRPAAGIEDITITAFGGFTEVPAGVYPNDGSTVAQWSTRAVDALRPPMTMVDRSDSGCRLHGPTGDASPITPGALIAFRDGVASPWTLGVVRRVKKRLGGKRVEIGVEFVGNDPRRIIVAVPDSAAGPPGGESSRCAALYLPQSTQHPVLPIKTLVLPARWFAPEDLLTLRTNTAVYTVRLKQPLEEQGDFLWSPFEIVHRRQVDSLPAGLAAAQA